MLQPATKSTDDVYRPRNPQNSGYFQCVQNHFEVLEMAWEERYQSRYGSFRPYVNVYCSKTLWSGNDDGIENLARYIIRAWLIARAKAF
ncbi:MAG: hypothetical protein U5L07_08765 [Desulfobacterales bacterium]|nr:hypothetical protein [Desulfobacterales bacterium]